MKKILIPTDFSENAEYALKVAAQIARENDGEIIILKTKIETINADIRLTTSKMEKYKTDIIALKEKMVIK